MTKMVPAEATELAAVNVGVARAGRMTVATFARLAALIQRRAISLSDLTPDAHPFAPQAGDKGSLLWDYTYAIDRESAPLSELQMHASVLVLIGVMDCGECGNIKESHAAFVKSVVPKFQSALVTRCFAFNPSEAFTDDIPGLVVIPSVGDLEFYIHNMWCDIASNLLTAFHRLSSSIEHRSVINSPPASYLGQSESNAGYSNTAHGTYTTPQTGYAQSSSPTNTAQSINIGSLMPGMPTPASVGTMLLSPEARLRKRTPGRAQKLIGDLYLLAGRLPEAIVCYTSAIEQTKANTDFLWLASALEGYYTAFLMFTDVHSNPSSILLPMLPENVTFSPPARLDLMSYTEKYREVISMYEKACAPMLVIKTSIRLSKVLGWIARELCAGISILATKLEAASLLTKTWETVTEELTLRFKIETTLEISSVFSLMGYTRKEGLFLLRAIELLLPQLLEKSIGTANTSDSVVVGSPADLISLVHRTCEVYGVGKGQISETHERGWSALQLYCLRIGIQLSEVSDNSRSIVYFTAYLLRTMFHILSSDEQTTLLASVQKVMVTKQDQSNHDGGNENEDMTIFPDNLISSLDVQLYPAHLLPTLHRKLEVTSKADDPFLYNPFDKNATGDLKKILLVQGEPVKVNVHFINPFAFDFEFQSVTLTTEGSPFLSTPASIVVPSRTTDFYVTLTGIPLESGFVTFSGCRIKLFGCLSYELRVASAATEAGSQRLSNKTVGANEIETPKQPTNSTTNVNSIQVINRQPLLRLSATSLTHRTLSLLEGQRAHVQITVENIGQLPVNWISVVVKEEQSQVSLPLGDNLSPDRAYFAEWREHNTKLFLSYDKRPDTLNILPGDTFNIVLDVFGKYECIGAVIKIVYASILTGDMNEEDIMVTRDITFTIAVSVQKSLSIVHFDVLPFQITPEENRKSHSMSYQNLIEKPADFVDKSSKPSCMLVLDVENSHSGPIEITVQANQLVVSPVVLHAASTKRILIPFECIDEALHNFDEPIPLVVQKQFIFSNRPKVTASEEHRVRRSFWLKKLLLERITSRWTASGNMHGAMNLSLIELSETQQVELCTTGFTIKLAYTELPSTHSDAVQLSYRIRSNQDRTSHSLCIFCIDEIATLEQDHAGRAFLLGPSKRIVPKLKRDEEYEILFLAMFATQRTHRHYLQVRSLPTLTLAGRHFSVYPVRDV